MSRTVHLEDTLGEGAFGVVRLARVSDEEGFVQRLAVKMLHAHFSADDDLARRLRDEARLLALLEHDNIVRVHGLSRINGRLAILMEPIQGADLACAQGTPVPVRVVLQVVEAAASALCAAWETVPPGHDEPLKAVHRDIKPSNIMVTERGGVKVMDFGVARARFDHREAHTQSQQFGTARYMAPERWLEGISGAPSDVFSLGITMVELLTGAPVPRPRLSRASFEQDLAAVSDSIEPDAVRDLVKQMCAFDPNERPDAREVVHRCRALEDGMQGVGLRGWAEEWVPQHRFVPAEGSGSLRSDAGSADTFAWTPDVEPTGTAPIAPVHTEALASTTARRRWRAGWLGGALVLGAVGLGWWSWPGSTTEDLSGRAGQPTVVNSPQPASVVEPVLETLPPASGEAPSAEAQPSPPVVPEAAVAEPVANVRSVVEPPRTDPPRPAPAVQPDPPVTARTEPEPAAEAPSSTVTFALSPASLQARTGDVPLAHYTGAQLHHGIHQVQVTGVDGEWRCTVRVDAAPATWRIDDAARTCMRIQ